MKLMIAIGTIAGGFLGGQLGAWISHDGGFGLVSIGLATIGSLVGIWAGYIFSRNYL